MLLQRAAALHFLQAAELSCNTTSLPAIAYGVICCNNSDAAQRSLKLLQFAATEKHLAHQKKL